MTFNRSSGSPLQCIEKVDIATDFPQVTRFLLPRRTGLAWLIATVMALPGLVFPTLTASAAADEIVLHIEQTPPDGLVFAPADLTPAMQFCGMTPGDWRVITAKTEQGQDLPMQFVPDFDFDSQSHFAGLVVIQLPSPEVRQVKLAFGTSVPPLGQWDGTVRTANFVVRHAPPTQAGFPVELTFLTSGKTFPIKRWADRVHDPKLGSFLLCDYPSPTVELLADGPLCTAVRIHAKYGSPKQSQPPGEPFSDYDFIYFHTQPLVLVRSRAVQKEVHPWSEHHILELQFNRQDMPAWAVGEPEEKGTFGGTASSHQGSQWGFISDGQNIIAMLSAGAVLIYDSGQQEGNYLQAHGDRAWQTWDQSILDKAALLWIGTSPDPTAAVRQAFQRWSTKARLIVTTAEVRHQLDQVAADLARLSPQERRTRWWQAVAELLERQGRFAEVQTVAQGKKPEHWVTATAGQLGLLLSQKQDGVEVVTLRDIGTGTVLVEDQHTPLFTLHLRRVNAPAEEIRCDAAQGWQKIVIEGDLEKDGLITWQGFAPAELKQLEVQAQLRADPSQSAFRWSFSVQGVPDGWTLWQVDFPQLGVNNLGQQGCLLYPQGCGIEVADPWSQSFRYHGRYPSGWTSMQFVAVYRTDPATGLYVAVHDPWGSTKEIALETDTDADVLQVRYEHPVPDMGQAANRYEMSGHVVWQLLPGNWYDAAQIYRAWVVQEAKWYPPLGENGREDTPQWMRELPLWALYGGPTGECAAQTKRFAEFFAVPCGVHWYNWHMNPFDNDYPHYFPTKPEFPDGVRQLRAAGVHVMPYINGRLWDTRDRGMEDFEFTQRAKAAASKNDQGEPYLETYGSKESDGSPVRLAVMCPNTELWQSTVRDIVLRLFREFQVDAVYIDQIAAAAPTLCFDKSHGHPLGGGHWWTEGYWKLLEAIRREKPAECMLTTECNGEPYIRWMDGYLTWHWQYDGQVPAFPAIYGGAIQMFGRSYGGGPTRDLAMRQRAAQQLVFGEQLGWLSPSLVDEKENAEFFKRLVQVRWQAREYFYAGRMLRPPQPDQPLQTLRADWQWGGSRWVTTPALLCGAWHLPAKQKVLVLAVNVGDAPIKTTLLVDIRETGWQSDKLRLVPVAAIPGATTATSTQQVASPGQGSAVRTECEVPPRSVSAWEIMK